MSSRDLLKLYKVMLRESQKLSAYNFRKYAIRRIHDGFKENRNLEESFAVEAKIREAETSLEIIKRQAIIGQMYGAEKLVIENILKS